MTLNLKSTDLDHSKKATHPWADKPTLFSIIGGIGSGKTSALFAILGEKRMVKNFHHVYFFTGNNMDDKLDLLDPAVEVLPDKFEILSRVINDIMVEAKARKQDGLKLYRYFIILDDCVGNPQFFRQGRSLLNNFVISLRHFNSWMCCISQKTSFLPVVVRSNCTVFIVFRIPPNESDLLWKSLPWPKKKLQEAYEACTSEPFGFLQINVRDHKLICGFDKLIMD